MNAWEQELAQRIDWSHPELANPPAAAPRQQLLAVMAQVRRHDDEYFGFTNGFTGALRRAAAPQELAAARQRIDTALAGDLFFPPHTNALAALGEETLLLGLDADRGAAVAQKVLSRQADWAINIWTFGITHGVAQLLRCLCAHRECRDEDLLPVFGWLCAIAPVEWAEARTWAERMLGCNGHNWWAHSFFGFWMAGALFPQFRGLSQFAAFAPTYLERELNVLFAADGWSKEGAAGYHQFAAFNVIGFARLAARHGVEFSPAFRTKLRTVADATWRMLAPDGDGPMFGDCAPAGPRTGDGLSAVRQPVPAATARFRRLAARFELTQAKGVLDQLEPDAAAQPTFLSDNGDDLTAAYRGLRGEPPPLDTALPDTGLYAMRTGWTTSADWLAINAMPVGEVGSSHKHADIFNMEVCVRGRRVLVDNWYGDVTENDGSYRSAAEIRNDPQKRRWRVGSSAHNVATVNNEDHVPVQQIYRYGWPVRPFVETFVSEPQFAFFSGVQEGYRRLAHPVAAHRRSIFYLRGEYWIVLDRFTVEGEAARSFQQHFHLLAGTTVLPNGQVRTHGPGGNLLLAPVPGMTGQLRLESNPHPIRTYQNPDHVQLEANATGDWIMAVVLAPFADDAVPDLSVEALAVEADERRLSSWEATALAINVNGRRDVYYQQHMHWNLPWQAGGCAGTGRWFHSQCEASAR
ncbi:MAG: hypothetical protein PCFJNLEI_01643 [Verrucomicrobiae bacterium]|nr:hypothetical protein [Verrucomicrobiae bacterium]